MEYIDLRSDTVTKPSRAMRRAISKAEVGDDGFGEDPTVNRLQEMVAKILGKEDALFTASGTMSNQIAIKVLTRPGDEVILEVESHTYNYESGAPPVISGVQLRPLRGERGILTQEQVAQTIRGPDTPYLETKLVCLENTHNRAGGTIFPLEEMERIWELCQSKGIKVYLDGARLFNASVATGVSPADYARHSDAVSICLSKGLGAPVGSVLAGDKEFVLKAKRTRKLLGGGMRQVGILAAAGIYALENNLERLAEDHQKARFFAEQVNGLGGIEIDLEFVQTNLVVMNLANSRFTVGQAIEELKREGVLVVRFGSQRIRAVAHLDVSMKEMRKAVEAFRRVFR